MNWNFFPSNLLRLHSTDVSKLHRLSDFSVSAILASFFFAPFLPSSLFLPSVFFVATISSSVCSRAYLYESMRHLPLSRVFWRVLYAWMLLLVVISLLIFFSGLSLLLPTNIFFFWASLQLFFLLFFHVFVRYSLRLSRVRGCNSRSVLFWGPSTSLNALQRNIVSSPWLGLKVVKWFSQIPQSDHEFGLPNSGGLEPMKSWLNNNNIDLVVFSGPIQLDPSSNILATLGDIQTPIYYFPEWSLPSMQFSVQPIGALPTLRVWGASDSSILLKQKRIFDFCISLLSITLCLPLFLLVSVLVRLTSEGPVIYTQKRYGKDGTVFTIFKFRTMHQSANQQGYPLQATIADSRVTPIGRFLRRTSLDEIPQLFNVLIGDMSMVGPRPHAVEHNEFYRQRLIGYMQRHSLRPGLTGLAQVSGCRGQTPTLDHMSERLHFDLVYQREMSMRLDLKIIFKTFFSIFSDNAY